LVAGEPPSDEALLAGAVSVGSEPPIGAGDGHDPSARWHSTLNQPRDLVVPAAPVAAGIDAHRHAVGGDPDTQPSSVGLADAPVHPCVRAVGAVTPLRVGKD